MQAIISVSWAPLDEAVYLCRQLAHACLFTIHYKCSGLISLIFTSLQLQDFLSPPDARAELCSTLLRNTGVHSSMAVLRVSHVNYCLGCAEL